MQVHYPDQLFRVWLWELSEETAGPAEWCTFGSPWGRLQRPSRMEHLHFGEPLEEGSARGDSLSSQHQAREETEAPQRTPGGRSLCGLPAVPCMCVDETVRTLCLVPPPGGWSWNSPIRAGIRERPPCPE